MLKKNLLLPFVVVLSQCSPSSSGSGELPVLSSPARARAWGAPSVAQTKKSYAMTYTNPSNDRERLVIKGSRKPFYFLSYPPNLVGTRTVNGVPTKVSEPQLWNKSLVLNQPVKWYQRTLPNEQDGAIFRTLSAEIKTTDGSSGSYLIEVEGTKNQMQTWLSELRFDQ